MGPVLSDCGRRGNRRIGRGPARCHGHARRRQRYAHSGFDVGRRVSLPERRSGNLHPECCDDGLRHDQPLHHRQPGFEHQVRLSDEGAPARRGGHRHQRTAGRRHQARRHGHGAHQCRAVADAAVARSLGGVEVRARRARRPRLDRRLRSRPAVELRRQGRFAARYDLQHRRRRHHRHVVRRLLAGLLRLRLVRGDQGRHRRQRPQGIDGRRWHELHDQARHQQLPRQHPQLSSATTSCSLATCPTTWSAIRVSPAATRHSTSTRSTTMAPTSAARSSRTSSGSGAPTARTTSA